MQLIPFRAKPLFADYSRRSGAFIFGRQVSCNQVFRNRVFRNRVFRDQVSRKASNGKSLTDDVQRDKVGAPHRSGAPLAAPVKR